jgi:hypothetical protein
MFLQFIDYMGRIVAAGYRLIQWIVNIESIGNAY